MRRPGLDQMLSAPQPVGGAISSRPLRFASGPSCVTDTAAISSTTAIETNTAVRPQPLRIHRIAGMMPAVAGRHTPAAQPKPDARALVGNTSEQKICMALPATWMKKIMMKPAINSCASFAALANAIAISPAAMNAHADVIFRPMLSRAYIMKMLAHGTAQFMMSVYLRD